MLKQLFLGVLALLVLFLSYKLFMVKSAQLLGYRPGDLVQTTFSACPSYLTAMIGYISAEERGTVPDSVYQTDLTNLMWAELVQPLTSSATFAFSNWYNTAGHGYSNLLTPQECMSVTFPFGQAPVACMQWEDCIPAGSLTDVQASMTAHGTPAPVVCSNLNLPADWPSGKGVCRPNWTGCPPEKCSGAGQCAPGMQCVDGECIGTPLPQQQILAPFLAQGIVMDTDNKGNALVQWLRFSSLYPGKQREQCRAVRYQEQFVTQNTNILGLKQDWVKVDYMFNTALGMVLTVTDSAFGPPNWSGSNYSSGYFQAPWIDPVAVLKSQGIANPTPGMVSSMSGASVTAYNQTLALVAPATKMGWPLVPVVPTAQLSPIASFTILDYNASFTAQQLDPQMAAQSPWDHLATLF